MSIKTLIGMAALAISSLSAAHEVAPDEASASLESRSRAEVLAEVVLWQRVGLDRYDAEGADQSTIDYQRRMGEYARLRHGPQYVAELQRIQAAQIKHAAVQSHPGG